MTTPCTRTATYAISRNSPIRTALTFLCRHRRLYLSQTQNYQRMHISFENALKMGAKGMFCSSKLQVKLKRYDESLTMCVIIQVLPKRTQVYNLECNRCATGDKLHDQSFACRKCVIVRNTISFHINLLQCYASHRLKQVCCLALAVIIFCLTIVAYYICVSFLNACYVGFGPVFFCT